MARYEPVNVDRLTPEHKDFYDAVRANRPKLVGPFSVLMHNPALAKAVNQVVDAVRKDGKIEKRLYELIVLIVVRHASAAYAGRCTIRSPGRRGCRAMWWDAILARRKPAFAKADEKVIYDAVTELLNDNKIGDAAYQALIKQFGLQEAIEIVTCVGLYGMIGAVINAFEVPTPNGEKPF